MSHTNRNNSTTVLCLERQFRPGQCFPGTQANRSATSGLLIVVLDCFATQLSASLGNAVMNIRAVTSASQSCPVVNGYQVANWPVLDGTTKVCATVYLVTT
ncbi:hypothetical protein OG401_41255 [Kitasatospora purpeofusca]|nr:hypothetical protein [Kitasatospora purpeofusca]MCX4690649.1 hypothetical protein [Kitasatospora purpeofusca]